MALESERCWFIYWGPPESEDFGAEAGFATHLNKNLALRHSQTTLSPMLHHSRGGQCLWDKALHGQYVGDWAGSVDLKNSLEIPSHPRWDLTREKTQDYNCSLGFSLGAPSALPFLASHRRMLGLTPSCRPRNREVPGGGYTSNAAR